MVRIVIHGYPATLMLIESDLTLRVQQRRCEPEQVRFGNPYRYPVHGPGHEIHRIQETRAEVR